MQSINPLHLARRPRCLRSEQQPRNILSRRRRGCTIRLLERRDAERRDAEHGSLVIGEEVVADAGSGVGDDARPLSFSCSGCDSAGSVVEGGNGADGTWSRCIGGASVVLSSAT